MEIKELGHVVLYVRDIERSRSFYGGLLGFRELASGSGFAAFGTPRTHHEMLLLEVGMEATPIPNGRRVGMYHFGLKIGDSDDDLREAVQSLREADIAILGATDHGVTHSLYLQDPDGNELAVWSEG